MNPLTNVRNIQNLNLRELDAGTPFARSWHQQYRDSAWVFVGGLDYELTEGDVITVFSQYGEINSINLVRDKEKGKSKGFGFVCYKNQLSTVLAVDNLNSIKLCGRTLRVDHVEEYRVPKMRDDMSEEAKRLALQGCAPVPIEAPAAPSKSRSDQKEKRRDKERKPVIKEEPPLEPLKTEVVDGVVLPPRLFGGAPIKREETKPKKEKKKKSKKSKRERRSSSSSSSSDEDERRVTKDEDKKSKKKRRVDDKYSSDDDTNVRRKPSTNRSDAVVKSEPMEDDRGDGRSHNDKMRSREGDRRDDRRGYKVERGDRSYNGRFSPRRDDMRGYRDGDYSNSGYAGRR